MPSPDHAPQPPARRPALLAFLRGIEVRGWVFALRQCGDEARAERGLARALHEFLAQAPAEPLAAWPIRFWACLLQQPGLNQPADPSASGLAAMGPGARAALLLRLVAGLDEAHASQALGVSPAAYGKALNRALSAPGMDGDGVEQLRRELQVQVHDASAAQRQLLAAWRDEALLALDDAPPATEDTPTTGRGRRRWLLALGACVLAVVGLELYLGRARLPPGPPVVDQVAPPPAMTDAVAVTHPDYLLVAAPGDQAIARELPFYSWMAAATLPAPMDMPAAAPATAPASFDALAPGEQALLASARTAWPELDPPTRASLVRQARDWLSREPAQRERLRQDLLAWDKLPAPEHAVRRTPFAAWQRLSENERSWVSQAAAHVAKLPEAEQAALRAQFAASPPDTQALWWLGPGLGQELAPFSSLFSYLPEADRPPLLAVLRELDPDARADLGLLAPRLTEAQRQALRRDLLAAPAAQRAELIRDRLAR